MMKCVIAVAALAAVANAQADCQTVALSKFASMPLSRANQDNVAAYCKDPAKLKTDMNALLMACQDQKPMVPVFVLLKEHMCSNDEATPKAHFCWPDLSKLVPWTDLLAIGSGSGGAFSFREAFDVSKLKDACQNGKCVRKATQLVMKMHHKFSDYLPKEITGDFDFSEYAQDIVTSCAAPTNKNSDEQYCAVDYKKYLAGNLPTKDQVCDNGKLKNCIKTVVARRSAFQDPTKPLFPGGFDISALQGVCACSDCTPKKVVTKFEMKITNIASAWFASNKDAVTKAVIKDIAFQMGILDQTTIKIDEITDKMATSRRLLQAADIEVKYTISSDADLSGQASTETFFPALDALDAASKQDPNAAASATSYTGQCDSGCTTPTKAPVDDDTNAAAHASSSFGILLVGLFVALFFN